MPNALAEVDPGLMQANIVCGFTSEWILPRSEVGLFVSKFVQLRYAGKHNDVATILSSHANDEEINYIGTPQALQ